MVINACGKAIRRNDDTACSEGGGWNCVHHILQRQTQPPPCAVRCIPTDLRVKIVPLNRITVSPLPPYKCHSLFITAALLLHVASGAPSMIDLKGQNPQKHLTMNHLKNPTHMLSDQIMLKSLLQLEIDNVCYKRCTTRHTYLQFTKTMKTA